MKRLELKLGAAMCIAAMTLSVASAETIENVNVSLTGTSYALPPALARRMSAAIEVAAEKIYIGTDSETVAANRDTYDKVTRDIIDRILYGYTVSSISINPGATSELNVSLRPYGPVVKHVETSISYGNLTPVAQELVAKDAAFVQNRIEQVLLGAPLDSLDWANAITGQVVRNELEAVLPEFIPQVDIRPGETTKATIYLIPQGAVVRHSTTEISSDTLPTSVFFSTKTYFDEYLANFEGVPVSFIGRHEKEILANIQERLDQSRASTRFNIGMTPKLQLGTDLVLQIQADSSRYIMRGEGYLDTGHKRDHNVGFKFFTGIKQGRSDWYLETNFYPDNYEWAFYPSYAYHITADTTVGYQYNVSDSFSRLWVRQTIADKWHLRAQREFPDDRNEFGLAYDVNNYLAVEYVVDDDNRWIRLIGYL
ncbi:MAG: hypothetical protein KHZ77_05380 [Veillonella sp.]|uniref:hypothetical protein n=1 Tax=Veillonella sp. TaxID=1926307 RepID=UPI0025D9A6AD|nr:hypothetical protein [Veillonella sp.]MBS4913578.1 hypothetical protein [Veillonella sp.]